MGRTAPRTAPTSGMPACMLLLIPLLAGCRIPALSHATPGRAVPADFQGQISDQNSAAIEIHEFFNDPTLTNLINQAMVENQELKILAQDIRIAQNEIMARQGAYLPFVFFGGRAGLEKPSFYTPEGAVEDQLTVNGRGFPEPLPDFLVATNVSWEIDLWGKLRNARQAACLRYLGTAEGRNFVITRLVAEISENYYELLALDQRLKTLDNTIALQEQSFEVAKAMKEAARGTELAVQRFQAEVRKNQSEKFLIQQKIVEVENRINLLAGRFPQPVERSAVNYFDLNLPMIHVGIPAQLLQNRPDIRQARQELAASGLDVKVAEARFYPSLVLSAGVGYRAFDGKYLFSTPESMIYNAAGEVVAPLINRKAIKADYLNANAQQMQAVYNYQRVVLNAFTEVMNQISRVENFGNSIDVKNQQLESLEASVQSATNLFQNARAEYVEVLLAQRDLNDARFDLIETKQGQLAAIVRAYQALGGGLRINPQSPLAR